MQIDVFIKRRNNSLILFGLLIVLMIASIALTQYDVGQGLRQPFQGPSYGESTNFYPDGKFLEKLPDILGKLWDTFLISISSTVTAAVPALFLAFMGSRPTRAHAVFTAIARGIGSFFRNMPLVAWAMILMLAFSQSSLTGFLALFFGSLGFLVRAFMEALDEVDTGTIEALKATGLRTFTSSSVQSCLAARLKS